MDFWNFSHKMQLKKKLKPGQGCCVRWGCRGHRACQGNAQWTRGLPVHLFRNSCHHWRRLQLRQLPELRWFLLQLRCLMCDVTENYCLLLHFLRLLSELSQFWNTKTKKIFLVFAHLSFCYFFILNISVGSFSCANGYLNSKIKLPATIIWCYIIKLSKWVQLTI